MLLLHELRDLISIAMNEALLRSLFFPFQCWLINHRRRRAAVCCGRHGTSGQDMARKWPVILTVLAFFLLCPALSQADGVPLRLSEDQKVNLEGHWEQLVDPTAKMTLADVIHPDNVARFSPLSGNMNRGYTREAVWLRFFVQRSAAFQELVYLRLGPYFIDRIEIYEQIGDDPAAPASYRQFLRGDHVPSDTRFAQVGDYNIPLTLKKEAPCWVYIRVKSTSTVTLFGYLHSLASFISYSHLSMLLNGGYLAVALAFALINMLFFLRLRDGLYLFFSLYLFFQFISNIGVMGVLPLLMPRHAHLWSDYLVGCSNGLSLSSFALFAMRLFSFYEASWFTFFFRMMVLLGLILALSVPFDFYGPASSLMLICLCVIIAVLTWISVQAVRRKEPGGRLYLAAFGLSNIAYASYFLRLLGLIPVYWWNLYGIHFATLFNMILMTLALTERMRAAEKQAFQTAEEAKSKAVELARSMTVELQTRQEQLEEALDRQTRFVDMISHEYRTPLAVIKANLDILRDRRGSMVQGESVALMQRAVARLIEVMEKSLLVSRLTESFHASSTYERIELADFLCEIRDEAMSLRMGADIVLPPNRVDLTFVLADRAQLKTAILNLIDNAVKYGGAGGPVVIGLETGAREVRISIADRGPGIHPNELERVRRKFIRGKAGTGNVGRGIGLYLVDRIVAEHGGRLEFSPNSPSGAIVAITLSRCT